jgi:hypothetical protein
VLVVVVVVVVVVVLRAAAVVVVVVVKGKAIQLLAWAGPEGSRRLRLPDFMTIGTRKW